MGEGNQGWIGPIVVSDGDVMAIRREVQVQDPRSMSIESDEFGSAT